MKRSHQTAEFVCQILLEAGPRPAPLKIRIRAIPRPHLSLIISQLAFMRRPPSVFLFHRLHCRPFCYFYPQIMPFRDDRRERIKLYPGFQFPEIGVVIDHLAFSLRGLDVIRPETRMLDGFYRNHFLKSTKGHRQLSFMKASPLRQGIGAIKSINNLTDLVFLEVGVEELGLPFVDFSVVRFSEGFLLLFVELIGARPCLSARSVRRRRK